MIKHRDYKHWVLGVLSGAIIGLSLFGLKRGCSLNDTMTCRVEAAEQSIVKHEEQLKGIDKTLDRIDKTCIRIEQKVDSKK